MAKKPNSLQGRRKLEMVKIPKRSNLQVTFSKRKSGIFKKASELCTLCGVEIAIVIFSPANKPFSFGHPGFDSVTERYIAENSSMKYLCPKNINNNPLVWTQTSNSSPIVDELNMKLSDLNSLLEGERKKGQEFDEMRQNSNRWWESPVDELSLKELELLKASLEGLKDNVGITKQAFNALNDVPFEGNPSDDLIFGTFASTFPNAHYNFGFGNGIF